jgi:hypothetical protein
VSQLLRPEAKLLARSNASEIHLPKTPCFGDRRDKRLNSLFENRLLRLDRRRTRFDRADENRNNA